MSLIVLSSIDDAEKAKSIARTLVEEKLAACVNIVPGATSIFFWKGELQEAGEILMIIKSRAPLWKRLRARLKQLHPYEIPEIAAVKMQKADRRYAEWLKENTRLIRVAGGNRSPSSSNSKPQKKGLGA